MINQNQILSKSSIWNTSNMLSMFRGVLAVPMAFALWRNEVVTVILISVAAVITDLMDGYLARRLNQISEFGKIVDPVADKIFVGTAALILIIQGRMPLWFGIAIMARDLLIMTGGIYATKKMNYVIPSNYPGKITVLILVSALLGILLDIEIIRNYGIYVALAAMIASFTLYFVNMLNKLNEFTKSRAEKL